MSIITGMRMVSGLTAGSINAAELTGIISTPAGAAGWKAAISSAALAQQLVQDPLARASWMGSTAAVNAALKVRGFVRMWLSHPDALDSLMSTASSVTALLESREARIALWSHDQGLSAMGLSATAMTAAKASSHLKTSSALIPGAGGVVIPGVGRYILAFMRGSANIVIQTLSKRPGSAIPSGLMSGTTDQVAVIPLIGPASFMQGNNMNLTASYFLAD